MHLLRQTNIHIHSCHSNQPFSISGEEKEKEEPSACRSDKDKKARQKKPNLLQTAIDSETSYPYLF